MSKRCEICGRGPVAGKNVSHSNRRTPRRWLINLQKVALIVSNGSTKRVKVCTSCLKSFKADKSIKKARIPATAKAA